MRVNVKYQIMKMMTTIASLVAVVFCCASIAAAQFVGGPPLHRSSPTAGGAASPDVVDALLNASVPAPVLVAGDLVTVQVYEAEKYNYKTRVSDLGTISLPLVETVAVQGKTADEAELAIATQLQALGMIKSPHVHVTITDQPSQFFTVAGEVNKPGTFPSYGARSLLSAVTQAGGLREEASPYVTLLRPGAPAGYVLDLGGNPALSSASSIPIHTGDTVVAGAAGVVYVVGAVKLTGVYRLKSNSPTTAAQAVALAGGVGFEADWKSTIIVRVINGSRTVTIIDIKAIQNAKADDPILQADDILFIPSNLLRSAIKANGAALAVSLAQALLYR